MSTPATIRAEGRFSNRLQRKRAAISCGGHGQSEDFRLLSGQMQPSGYYGNSDAILFLADTLRSAPEFGVPANWISTGTGCDSLTHVVIELDEEETPVVLCAGDLVAAIQAVLSLQIKELAEILKVKRPTIYSWINNEGTEPHPSNRERLQQVYRIAQAWNARCHLPADRLIRVRDADGISVVDLLKADDIDEDAVVSRFDGLVRERMRLKAEADAKRPPVATIAERHGFELRSESEQQHAIDVFTAKRSSAG